MLPDEQSNVDDWLAYPIIGELEHPDLQAIIPFIRKHKYAANEVILTQGEASESFHIVLSGSLDVYIKQDTDIRVAVLERGHFFGEMSCLTGNRVSANVRALEAVETLSMSKEGMLLLMDRSASFRNHMITAMIARIGESNERVVEEYTRSFAVMRELELEREAHYGELIGSSPWMVQLRERITQLARKDTPICIVGEKGVGKFHTAYQIHHQSNRVAGPILSMHADDFKLEAWERKVRAAKDGTVVLEGASALPERLLHQITDSDFLGRARLMMTASKPLQIPIETIEIASLRERAEDIPELVSHFLHEATADNDEELISAEALNMIKAYPYLESNVSELKRVVQEALIVSGGQMILGKHLRFGTKRKPGTRPKIGLALGSGSSRGAAHVGVLKVLEEAQIPVDVIAGTSVGAFIGALYVGGQPISAFERVLPNVKWRQLVKPTLPPAALVSNHPMSRFVEKYIGPVHFEELPIPFAAVASDALSGEAYILNKGKVSHAICASTAIPGVMKPVKLDGRLLVDGAVVHPVPTGLAKSMGADIVIAVDLSMPSFMKRKPKNFVASILNTIEIMSKKILTDELQLADFVLNPMFESQTVSFKASANHIKSGAFAARDIVAEIEQKIHTS